MPPGMPAPMPVVPTSIMTGTSQRGDRLEQRVEAPVVDREVLHDRMEVEAEHAEVFDGVPRFADGCFALDRLDRAPAWMMRSGCRFHMPAT